MNSGTSSISCSTRETHCVTLVTITVISHKCGKDRIVITRKTEQSVVICDTDILKQFKQDEL